MIDASAAYNERLARQVIYPKWKLLSYNPTLDSWGDIISGTLNQTPTDLSSYVSKIEYSFDRLAVTLTDTPDLFFHPDGGALRSALSQGRIIRLKEGFEDLAETDWLWTFSGVVEGTYSWTYQRGEQIQVQFTAYNRANNQVFKRRNVTSREFTIGSDWSSMFMNIAKDIMMLEDIEVAVPQPWGVLFDKNSNQIVNIPPWDAMEQLLFGIQAKPWFNGKGQLDLISTNQNRVTLTLDSDNYLRRYEARGSTSETINKVILLYLSNTLSRVDGPDQNLGQATVTSGFFTSSVDVDVFYSDDRKSRCDNPRMIIRQSANAGFISFCDETMQKIDEFHSRIVVTVSVWAGVIIMSLLTIYVILQAIPRGVITALFGGTTIPIQDILAAIVLISILLLMSSIGTGTYEVWGTPYEMVYLEKQAIAVKAGVEFWQEREMEIRNDFVSTIEQAQGLVLNQLHYEVMKEQPRTLILRYDPRIEPGDIIQLSSSMKMYVEAVSRGISTDSDTAASMSVTAYRTVL